jgi:hypothetical protein
MLVSELPIPDKKKLKYIRNEMRPIWMEKTMDLKIHGRDI